MAQEAIVIKKKKGGPAHGGAHGGAWKVAYADFVTAMMCFFLVMWLMGSDEETKAAIAHYFNHPNTPYHDGKDPKSDVARPMGENIGHGESVVVGEDGLWPEDLNQHPSSAREIMKEYLTISKMIQDLLEGKVYGVEASANFVKFSLPEQILFEPGSNILTPGAKKDLSSLGGLLKNFSGYIQIEGHTDDVKPKKDYANNWELSMARALVVMDQLTRQSHIDEDRFVPIAKASSQPLTSENTPAGRARNRRVEFILSYDKPQ